MTPNLMRGPRGHGYVILVPLVAEKLRAAALDLANEALDSLAPGQKLPGIAPELPAGWGIDAFLDTVKRSWSLDELVLVRGLLEQIGNMPLSSLLYKDVNRPIRKVPVRHVARIKNWKTDVAVENLTPGRDDEGPDGLPREWPLPSPDTKAKALSALCVGISIHQRKMA